MTDQSSTIDSFNEDEFDEQKLPPMLNVLTILTFIGCGIGVLINLFTPKLMSFSKEMIEKQLATNKDISVENAQKMQKGLENIELFQANIIPLMVVGFLGLALCFAGAMMMRKLKKDGFWIYVAGQAIPVIATGVILGFAQFKEIGNIAFLALAIIFIVMYSTQRKFLVK